MGPRASCGDSQELVHRAQWTGRGDGDPTPLCAERALPRPQAGDGATLWAVFVS